MTSLVQRSPVNKRDQISKEAAVVIVTSIDTHVCVCVYDII